jgi:hypothetical protein
MEGLHWMFDVMVECDKGPTTIAHVGGDQF